MGVLVPSFVCVVSYCVKHFGEKTGGVNTTEQGQKEDEDGCNMVGTMSKGEENTCEQVHFDTFIFASIGVLAVATRRVYDCQACNPWREGANQPLEQE